MPEPSRSNRLPLALALGLLLIAGLFAAQFLLTPPLVVEDSRDEGQVRFSAEPGLVFAPGDCVTASWQVDAIREVYFNQRGTVGSGSERVCITATTQPVLRVVFTDGASADYRLEVPVFLQRPVNWFLGLVAVFLATALVYVLAARRFGGAASKQKPRLRSLAKALLATVFGLFIAALFFEVALRAYFTAFGTQAEQVAYLLTREEIDALDPYMIALPEVDYGLSGEHSQNNALGYRGEAIAVPKPDDVFRIVTLGDSTTYGTSVRADQTYPYFLQQILRDEYGLTHVEVVNGGILGYTSYQIVGTMALRVPELEPDLVVLMDSINDLMPRNVHPDCYRGLNPLLGLDPRGRVVSSTRGRPVPASTLYRFLAINLRLERNPAAFDDTFVSTRVTCGDSTPYTEAELLAANPPTYFERNLTSMVGLARIHDIPFVLSNMAFNESRPEPTEAWRAGVAENNDVVARVAEAQGTPFIDFARLAPQDDESWAGDDPVHMSALGYRQQAEIFAQFLMENGLVGTAP